MAGESQPKSQPDKGSAATGVRDLFDAKQKIKSTHTSELVIALCGPIGSPLHKVAATLKQCLEDDFDYDRCEVIQLSKFIEDHSGAVTESSEFNRIKKLIELGDVMRKEHGSSVLAELAIAEIVIDRQREKKKGQAETYKPRRVCHIIDSIKNQEELDILRLVYRDMLYFVGVFAPLGAREKALEKKPMTSSEVHQLIDRDSGEELDHGQTVRNTFPQADFFLRVDADTDSQIKTRVDRFLHLILGTKPITPSYAETAMYLAASASGNSACLSRQVGAAVTDKDGVVLGVGWNDVPKYQGGLYESDPVNDPNGDKDKRCWNIEGGTCFNDSEKRVISKLIVGVLKEKGVIEAENVDKAVSLVAQDSKVKDLIEFSRSIHAEMHAILTASRLSGDRIRGGKLFCTTYPCHSCARHIIAAGIAEVYYIEPYRKSLATKLHDDAITESETDESKVRILPYDGVAPPRYMKLFCVPKDSRKSGGKMVVTNRRTATPRFDKTLEAMPTLEALVLDGLREKQLMPELPGED